ncbi:PIN domain-containing protein [Nocardia goodfellowii]
MIRYLVDSSAVWHLRRDPELRADWMEEISLRAIGSYAPQRVEVLYSCRNVEEYDAWRDSLVEAFPDVPLPKRIWSWIETAQHQLVSRGALRALSTVDLMLCATAVHHSLTILHDDNDFRTASRFFTEVKQVSVHSRRVMQSRDRR